MLLSAIAPSILSGNDVLVTHFLQLGCEIITTSFNGHRSLSQIPIALGLLEAKASQSPAAFITITHLAGLSRHRPNSCFGGFPNQIRAKRFRLADDFADNMRDIRHQLHRKRNMHYFAYFDCCPLGYWISKKTSRLRSASWYLYIITL